MDRVGVGAGEPAFGDGLAESFDDLADHPAEDPLGAVADELHGFGGASRCRACTTFQSLSMTCRRSSTSVTFSKLVITRRCSARSPSVTITQVRWWSGSRRVISALTSLMNASFPAVRLAQTRLRVGFGRFGRSRAGSVPKRLSITSFGVRTIGGWLWTAATVAIFFLFAFSPLVRLTTLCAPPGLTIGMPLQSIAPTEDLTVGRADLFGGSSGVEHVEVHGGVLDELFGRALRDRRAGDLRGQRDRFVERAADDGADQSALTLVAHSRPGRHSCASRGWIASRPRARYPIRVTLTSPNRVTSGRVCRRLCVNRTGRPCSWATSIASPRSPSPRASMCACDAKRRISGLAARTHARAPTCPSRGRPAQTTSAPDRGTHPARLPESTIDRPSGRPVCYGAMTEPDHPIADLARLTADYETAKARLAEIGFACEGSLIERYAGCKNPNCRWANPDQRHGPYWQISWKEAGKTVSKMLPTGRTPPSTSSGSLTAAPSTRSSTRCATSPGPPPSASSPTAIGPSSRPRGPAAGPPERRSNPGYHHDPAITPG